MPKGKQALEEYLRHALSRVKFADEDEPWSKMRFPRRDAKKRITNTEGKSRIQFPSDPTTYGHFHEQKERILRLLDDNPVLFGVFLTDVLKGFSNELVERWKAIHEGAGNAQTPTQAG